jgi:hypothetical protein
MTLNRTAQIVVGVAAVAVIGVCVALQARFRIQRAHKFGAPHAVTTYGGTNYVVALDETTVGRTDSGHVLLVYLRVENPNDFELVLDRDWFVLVDHEKNYFQPTTAGTQTQLIKVPARGVSEGESLSFALGPNALGGGITLKIGVDFWVLLKSVRPYTAPLAAGEFRTFRRADW